MPNKREKKVRRKLLRHIKSNRRFDLQKRIINIHYLSFGQCCDIDTLACNVVNFEEREKIYNKY